MTDIVVPQLGESVTEATVATWLKKPGEHVSKDEPVVELETDKVSLEVPAPEDGEISEIVANEGDTVEIGSLLGTMGGGGAKSAPAKKDAKKSEAKEAAPKPANGASAGGETVEVAVPQMGESVAEGTVGSWLKQEGDAVAKDEPIVEIETDKVAVEVPSPVDGVLAKQRVKEGDTVEVGAIIADVTTGAGAAPAKSAPKRDAEPAAASGGGSAEGRPMPSARRVLDEGGVSAAGVAGSGKGGRITKADALKAIQDKPSSTALQPVAHAREVGPREERVRMTRLRQTIAKRLKEAQNSAAMLTTFNEADMSAVMAVRKKYKDLFEKKHGIKLGFMSFFVKAAVQALKEIPNVNAEIDGTDIIYKNYYDIGIAVGTDRGLVVPVIRDADELSLGGIELEIAELGRKARDGDLTIDDMQGATFTISNGGVYGSLMSTPILNAPQSGILGMHSIQERPVVVDGAITAKPMMYLALSYDHRIVDGKEAVTFLVRLKECIEDPERLLLDL